MLVAVLTGLVLSFVIAGAVLHVSTVGSAAVQYNLDRLCPQAVGPNVVGEDLAAENSATLVEAAREAGTEHGFTESITGRYTYPTGIAFGENTPTSRLGHRDGALDHLRVVEGGDRSGLWIAQSVAEAGEVEIGDRPSLAGVTDLPPVTTVYADLAAPQEDYWCTEEGTVTVRPLSGDFEDAQVAFFADGDEFDDFAHQSGTPLITTVRYPVETPDTPEQAAALSERARLLTSEVHEAVAHFPVFEPVNARAYLDRPVELSHESSRTVTLAVLPLTLVSLLVGLVGVAAVAMQWCQRRHTEIRLLWSRGISPASIGGKAVLELGLPLTVGIGLGVGTAAATLSLFAPSSVIQPGTVTTLTVIMLCVAVIAVGVLAGTVALRTRAAFERERVQRGGRGRRVLALLPWELVSAGLAVWAGSRLWDGALTVETGEVIPRIDPVALAFPLLVVLTVAGLVARLLNGSLIKSHRLRMWSRPAAQLGIRRLAASRGTVTGVLVVALLAVGTIAVGDGVVTAQRQAFDAKSGLSVGAESAVQIGNAEVRDGLVLPDSLAGQSTMVGVTTRDILDQGRDGRIMAVDPATFADGAYADDTPLHQQISEQLGSLGAPDADGVVPALAVGGAAEGTVDTGRGLQVRTTGSLEGFPGLTRGIGYVISAEAVDQPSTLGAWYVWSTLDLTEVVDALAAVDVMALNTAERSSAMDALAFLTIQWTFSFIVVLGVVLAVLAVVSLLLAVEARRRQNVLSGALATRMGLRLRTLVSSYLVELSVVAVLAIGFGALAGIIGAELSAVRLDPAPEVFPLPSPGMPLGFLIWTVLIGAAVVAIASWIAVRLVRTARVGELIRG
ncbi:FtsX-like permease family [Actinoalloteichus sp. GBA129-24]|uniref:FtsX-like permease family n=2 Tax=Pseudonocardiaceae TaxID=2070 RepID=A0AAC9LDG0_9PSEU|nr:FtsX-like permease family [Actinoalloteichus fjordicus]APU20625.1 FtsX-like permease family [Actinoalloteichus sp. GBA129-24]